MNEEKEIELTILDDVTEVKTDTIIEHWSTADEDKEGYLINTGGNRTLCEAQRHDGEWILYVVTNGNIQVFYEGSGDEIIELMTSENTLYHFSIFASSKYLAYAWGPSAIYYQKEYVKKRIVRSIINDDLKSFVKDEFGL